jgi:hypothetical protein
LLMPLMWTDTASSFSAAAIACRGTAVTNSICCIRQLLPNIVHAFGFFLPCAGRRQGCHAQPGETCNCCEV